MLDPSLLATPGPLSSASDAAPVMPVPPVQRDQTGEVSQTQQIAQTLATAMDLLSALDHAENLSDAAWQASHWLRQILSADRVVILWRSQSRNELLVIADAGRPEASALDPHERLIIAAGEEVATRNQPTHWPPEPNAPNPSMADRHALMAIAQMARAMSVGSVDTMCLTDQRGIPRGVILALEWLSSKEQNRQNQSVQQWQTLQAVASPLASKLHCLDRLQPGPIETAIRRLKELIREARQPVVGALAVLMFAVMMFPLPYKIGADIELQATEHRYIAVPFDGPLESVLVQPGTVVHQGDQLAEISPRELQYELASLQAELNQAIQKKKGLMASHDSAGSKIAALESERLQLQVDLLQFRQDHREIRSPIDGVVVSGDWKQSEGIPMTRGDRLYEIAPLDQLLVEIAIPESDIHHVRKGMPVRFYVNALPNQWNEATIDRIHPCAELKYQSNVFIAQITIDNSENTLRPGMRGRAKIVSDRHPLGWNLFHRAYETLRQTVGW